MDSMDNRIETMMAYLRMTEKGTLVKTTTGFLMLNLAMVTSIPDKEERKRMVRLCVGVASNLPKEVAIQLTHLVEDAIMVAREKMDERKASESSGTNP